MVVKHIVQNIAEIVAVVGAVMREQRTDFGATRTGLDGISLDTIEHARVDVKAIIARGVVERDDDEVLFLAIGRHSVLFLSYVGIYIIP
jgi:hypothetical protein